MLPPWWERYPGRLEYELEALTEAGIRHELNQAVFAAGTVQLSLAIEHDGEIHQLVAVFPDLYPYFRFEVFAPQLALAHHQHPFSKNLCLIGRGTENWYPEDTLAEFLCDRLPMVLRSGQSDDPEAVRGIEEEQAEPFSDYYAYRQEAIVFVDSEWVLDPATRGGSLLIGLETSALPLRGAVLEVLDERGEIIARADDALFNRYAPDRRLRGRWIRTEAEVRQGEHKPFLHEIERYDRRLISPDWRRIDKKRRTDVDIVGVVFPEETTWRRTDDGWVFLLRAKINNETPRYDFVRAGYAGRKDLTARVPELRPLSDRRVAIFGLGALGMPSALALARAGIGELRAVDHDHVDAGTAPRWPFGLLAAGRPKAEVLEQFLTAEYPYTAVKSYVHRIGGDGADRRILGEVLDGVDLVYDATVEEGVHAFLDQLCRGRGIPYVYVSGTNGAWGGTVMRTSPESGCWFCFLAALEDSVIPTPREAPGEWVQPAGCASPTFTGAGFDLESIALMGVRLAVGTLVHAAPDGYPDASWDVAVGNLRDEQGGLISAQWHIFSLPRHPGCPVCASR